MSDLRQRLSLTGARRRLRLPTRLASRASAVFPESVQRWLHDRRRRAQWSVERERLVANDYIVALATRVALDALIDKTNDARTVTWLGRPIWQYPLDAWVLQEVVGALRPDLIIETGTFEGGSAYYLASLCDVLDNGQVMSIDIAPRGTIPHPRITYLTGSSVDPEIVSQVEERAGQPGVDTILVVLDSDHSFEHVRRELDLYAPFVSPGSYIHIQDGLVDPDAFPSSEPSGPVAAVRDFLRENPTFERDLSVERRYLVTAHPYGWLRRVRAEGRFRPDESPEQSD